MARVWRVVRTPLTLLVLLGLLGFGAWWGYSNVMMPPPPAPVEPCVPEDVEQLESSQVLVNVFNGGAERGKAAEVGQALEAAGFTVGSIGNTDERVTRTVVVGVTTEDPAVRLTLEHFQEADPRSDARPDGTVDVLIGTGYTGMVGDAPESIEVGSETACLPPTPTPPVG